MFGYITVGFDSFPSIELFVVVVFYCFAYSGEQAVAFANEMPSATFLRRFLNFDLNYLISFFDLFF